MGAVYIRIRHDDDLVIAKLADIKIVAISFRKTASERIDHGLDLCIGQDLIDAGFLYVQDLSTDGKDGLIHTVPGGLGRASGGISLYDEDLTQLRLPAFAIGQLAVGVKGVFLFCQKIGLGLFFRLSDLGRPLCAGKDLF